MGERRTREPQYQDCVDAATQRGFERLGLRTNQSWHEDPRHLLFRMARYKFVAKMLAGRDHVLEVGCGDAFCTRVVQQEVQKLTAVDFDSVFVEDVNDRMVPGWEFECFTHDILKEPVPGSFDAVFALDVLEHIAPTDQNTFLSNMLDPLEEQGVAIIGVPSLESQAHASAMSREGHVNCMSMPELKRVMDELFFNVFMFSMNDEVLHTGYHKMAHYLFAVGAGKRPSGRSAPSP
jgi:SAM-dependent methyltransferase